MKSNQPIRRVHLLENHIKAVWENVNKRFHRLPASAQAIMSREDLFQECMLELQRKRYRYYDARRGKFVTFVYVVVQRYIERQRQYHSRKKRQHTDVEYDSLAHGKKTFDDERICESEAVQSFVKVWKKLDQKLRLEVQSWFLAVGPPRRRKLPNSRSYIVFRRKAKHYGLTPEHCMSIMTNFAVRTKIKRQVLTCTARNGEV